MKRPWTLDDMPDQTGRTVLVTGANGGLGFHVTRAFAARGARVVMACRDAGKADRARGDVLSRCPGAAPDVVLLDLGDLSSVRSCAQRVLASYATLDAVILNAGIMAVPFGLTLDGLELQMGVNYYGHYALAAHLMPLIRRSPGLRIVTVSSAASSFGTLALEGPPSAKGYRRWGAYCDSKLAILMLALVLDDTFRARQIDAMGLSAHPGFAKTNLRMARLRDETHPFRRKLLQLFELMSMPAERGMLPILYAATDPDARPGQYIGVSGPFEVRGDPKVSKPQRRALDPLLRGRLLRASEAATGMRL